VCSWKQAPAPAANFEERQRSERFGELATASPALMAPGPEWQALPVVLAQLQVGVNRAAQ